MCSVEIFESLLKFDLSPRESHLDLSLRLLFWPHCRISLECEVDESKHTFAKKIAEAQVAGYNYILVVGEKEANNVLGFSIFSLFSLFLPHFCTSRDFCTSRECFCSSHLLSLSSLEYGEHPHAWQCGPRREVSRRSHQDVPWTPCWAQVSPRHRPPLSLPLFHCHFPS